MNDTAKQLSRAYIAGILAYAWIVYTPGDRGIGIFMLAFFITLVFSGVGLKENQPTGRVKEQNENDL